MIYRTYLTNFGYFTYVGPDLDQAKASALKAGFECVIYCDHEPLLSHHPVSGWRGLVASE